MNIREFKKICKIDTEIITDITADDTVSKDYGNSKLLIKPRIRNEYDEILTEFGY